MDEQKLSNAHFAASDGLFRRACECVVTGKRYDPTADEMVDVTLPPTQRQASKFRMGRGLAFAKRNEAARLLRS
jgi:hypothetical protein